MRRLALIVAVAGIGAGALWLPRFSGVAPAFVKEQEELPGAAWTVTTERIPLLTPHLHEYDPRYEETADGGGSSEAAIFTHGVEAFSEITVAPQDLWVTGYRLAIHNAPGITLHHAGITRMDEANPVCPQYRKELLGMAPPVEEPIMFPEPYGVFVAKGTPLQLYAMFHNPLPPFGPGGTYENVSASVTIEGIPAESVSRAPLEYVRLHIDDEPCADAIGTFVVPPRAEHFERGADNSRAQDPARYRFAHEGTIVLMGAHIHSWEGGEKVAAFLNGDSVAEFLPYRVGAEPWSWTLPIQQPENLAVRADDVLSIAATYGNPAERSVRGAMGMLGFWFTAR